MVYPPDPNELWDPVDDERDVALQEPQRALEESRQYVPPTPPIPVDEGSQLWDPEEEFVPTFTVERMQKIRGEDSLESAEEFADVIAAEIKEVRKTETGWAQRTVRGAKRLPVLGGILSAGTLWEVFKASERYNDGQFWKNDAKVIAAYMAEAERYGDLGVWDKALEIVLDIPGYAGEIALTGSAMTAGRQLVRKVGTEVAEKMVTRGVLKTLGAGVREAGGLAVGGAAMAAVSPWLVAEQVTQYAVQNSLKGENEAFAKALWQGPLSATIVLASEFAGGSTAAMLAKLPGIRKLKNFVTTNWLSADKTRTLAGFARLKDRIGWHGIIGEIEEERWDEMLHGLTGLTDDYGAIQGIFSDDEARQTEAWKQIGSETIAFTGIGLPFTVASAAQYRRAGMTARKALEKFAQSDNPSRGQYNALSEGIRAHMPVEGTPIAVEVGGETVTESFDPGKKHHRRAVRKNAQQILEQWDAMAASTPQEQKDRMVLEAEAILEATEDVATQRGAMGAYVDRLLKTRDPETGQLDGEAMLRDGISLGELRLRRIEVAGVPTNADRTAEELTREYPEAAGALIQSEETVTAELFEKLTGIPNASEEKIGEFGQQVQDIIGAQLMESLTKAETAQQQLSATATPAAAAPAAEEEEEFLVLPARSGAEMSPEQVQESLSLHDKYQNSGNESVDTKEEAIALARELKAMGFEPALELGHDLQTGKDVWHVRIKGPPSLKGRARTRATVAAAVARLRETGDNSYADQYKIEQEAIMGPAWSKLDAHEKEGAAEPVAAVPGAEPGAAIVEAAVGPKFQSGMTRTNRDLQEAIARDEPVGVTVLSVKTGTTKLRLISDNILELLKQAAEGGLPVFVDSGAFGLYAKDIEMPWDLVEEQYLRILESVDPQFRNNLYFVAPDVVGDIKGTVSALETNDWWKWFADKGVNVIYPVPMEKGVSFGDSLNEVGGADIDWDPNIGSVIGVPFNKAAWSEEDILDFYRSQIGEGAFRRVHLLGGGTNKVRSLAKQLNAIDPTITVSGDSTRKKRIGHRQELGMQDSATVPVKAEPGAVEEGEPGAAAAKGPAGRVETPVCGTCFKDVLDVAMEKSEGFHKSLVELIDEVGHENLVYVHGNARVEDAETGELKRGGHAWVEAERADGWVVWDVEQEKVFAREDYYDRADAVPEMQYTGEDLAILGMTAGHMGPYRSDELFSFTGKPLGSQHPRSPAPEAPAAAEPGAAAIGGEAGQFGPGGGFDTNPASHDAYAQHSQFAIALPELLELAQRLLRGEDLVRVEGALERLKKAGEFRAATAKRAAHILMNPKYASDAAEAAIILGHEIGHLINYLPHETLKNGNILGRVAGLQKYLKGALAGKIGGQEPMTDKEKRVVRKKVREDLGTEATKKDVGDEVAKRIAKENESRGVVTANELRAELIGLSEWWTPYQKDETTDEGKKHILYRNSSSELMAQALSVLLVAPKELQDRAPIFWELFGNYISRHPQFLKEYQELQDLLAGDSAELMKHRERRILDNYASGAEALIAAAAARDAARIDGWDAIVRAITQGILDRTAPGKKLGDDARKILLGKLHKKGTPTDAEMLAINKQVETLKNTLDELFTADAPAHAMVLKNQREVIEPLQRAGITLDDFGLYMEMRRDIMERGEIYNPGGHTPETAAEQLNHLQTRLADEIEDPNNPGERISQFDYLDRMARVFHSDIINPMVRKAVEAGVYSQAAYKSKIAPNVQNYATFLVIRHILSDEISPMIHDQTGTFEAIANPAVATLLKMVKLSRMTVLNRAKTALVDWMNEHFREEISPVKLPMREDKETGRTRPDWGALPKPNPGKAHLVVLVDGQSKVYEVDEYLSKVFLNADLGFLEGVTRVMNSVLYRTFHPLFVTYNPSFVAGNWLRDIQRTQRNLGAQGRRLEFETYVAELQAIRDTEGREPTDAEKQTAKKKASKMRMGLLDILKERHKLMGWGKVAQFLSFGKLQPGAARQFARGEKVELVEQMMAEHAYAVPLTDIESQVGGLLPGFVKEQLSPTERVAEQVKKLKDLEDPRMRDKFMRTVLPAVGRLWQAFELLGAERLARYGAAQELAGKMTGYNLLAEREVPVRERAMITRKDVGTPDFMQRGLVSSITNSLFMYSKVRWSALLRDWQLLKGDMPKTRAAWVTHQIIWTLMPTTVTKLAGYGMLASLIPGGDEPEEWYTMFSKYFLDNYDVIPLGYTEVAGKQHAVGLTIPRDEMRSFVAQMWGNAMDATLESMTDVETQAGTAPKAFQELADALRTNVLPNINPYLDIAGTWMAYSQGMNPRDRFYKGDVIPRSNWEAGGWESNRKLLAWTFKKTGVLNTALHPIAGPILGDAFDDAQEAWKTTTLRSTPMLQRFLRVSQRGVQDRRWAAMQEERGDKARFRLQLPTTVRKANGEQYLLSHTQHLLDDEGKQKLLVLNKWRSMTYMPAREKMLEASSAGDEQTFNQLRDQLSQVTQEIMAAPISETPPLYLGAVAWSLTDPSFEKPGESSELELLKVNRIDLSAVESLIKSEALRRNNQEIQRRSKRIGREIRTRQFPKYTRALSQRIARARDIFSGREPRRRRIGRAGMRR